MILASFEIEHVRMALVPLAYQHPNKPFSVGEYSVNLGGSLALVKLLTLVNSALGDRPATNL